MKLAVNRNKTVPALLSALACAAIWAHLDMSSYEPLLLGAFAALYFLFFGGCRLLRKKNNASGRRTGLRFCAVYAPRQS